MRIRLTGNPVDGSQRAQDAHGPDGRQADVVSVQRVLQHSARGGGREGKPPWCHWNPDHEADLAKTPEGPRGIQQDATSLGHGAF